MVNFAAEKKLAAESLKRYSAFRLTHYAPFPTAVLKKAEVDMDPTFTLANWRATPYSTQSYHNVDMLLVLDFKAIAEAVG